MGRGTPPQGRLRDHDHSRAGEGGSSLDVGDIVADMMAFDDNDTLDFGTDDDISLKFDPAVGPNGALVVRDEATGEDRLGLRVGDALRLLGQTVDLAGNDLVDGGTTIWDQSAGEIPNAVVEALANLAADEQLSAYPLEAADVDESTIAVTDFGVGTVADGQFVQNNGGSLAGVSVGGGGALVYGDGPDGDITRAADGNENGVLVADTYTVNNGVTMTVTTGSIIVVANTSITISGTINADEVGANGASADGSGGAGNPGSDGKYEGAGGDGGDGPGAGRGGGVGGTATINDRSILGFWPSPAYDDALTGTALGGSGGGSGGGDGSNLGGDGGDGGGTIILVAPDITVDGTLSADGQDGADSTEGGGGGGSGGQIVLIAETIDTTGATTSVSGGAGGTGNDGANGQDGDNGSVRQVNV